MWMQIEHNYHSTEMGVKIWNRGISDVAVPQHSQTIMMVTGSPFPSWSRNRKRKIISIFRSTYQSLGLNRCVLNKRWRQHQQQEQVGLVGNISYLFPDSAFGCEPRQKRSFSISRHIFNENKFNDRHAFNKEMYIYWHWNSTKPNTGTITRRIMILLFLCCQ